MRQIDAANNPVPCMFDKLKFDVFREQFSYEADGYRATYPEYFFLADKGPLNQSFINSLAAE